MRKKIFTKNIEAKVKTVSILILIIVASLTTIFIITNSNVKGATTDYLYYKQITISNTYVDKELTNFPLWVHNTSSDFASGILTEGQDIAFYDSTNSTRFNHEIEYWNKTTGELGCWVNVTSISNSANTVIYMYYGDSDTTDNRGYNPESVWDSDFVLVNHLNGTAYTDSLDSTSNNNDINAVGGTPDFETDAVCGYGIELTTTSGEYLEISDDNTLDLDGDLTIEVWVNLKDNDDIYMIYAKCKDSAPKNQNFFLSCPNDDNHFSFHQWDGSNNPIWDSTAGTADAGSWKLVQVRVDNGNNITGYVNGAWAGDAVAENAGSITNSIPVDIGANTEATVHYTNGYIDEIRFSKIARDPQWLITSYHNQVETAGFITFGTQAETNPSSSFSIEGLPSDKVSWNNTAGSTTWANESGTGYETVEVNMTINATDNVTEIRVWVDDLDTNCTASNITMYVSNDNTSFAVPTHNPSGEGNGIFPDGGGNISINQTTFPVGGGNNPFDDAGLTDKTWSIWLRFKISIPSGIGAETYTTASDAWKIYMGYYTT